MSPDLRTQAAKVLAFFERVLGLHPRSRPMEDLSRRSQRALADLDAPSGGFRFRVALAHLGHEWDLLCEDATEEADALRLQLRVLALAATIPEADRVVRPSLQEAPVARLFHAIVAQAQEAGAKEIGIAFGGDPIRVGYDGREAMTVPATLERPFRGVLRLVEAAGYVRVRAFLGGNGPQEVAFAWEGSDRLRLGLR